MTDAEPFSPVATVRRLMRTARTAALSTLARRTGHPFGSLVTVATEFDGTPIILLSGLAAHSRNLADDPRASLLFEDRISGDPQTGARATVIGRVERIVDDGSARRRYLARNPDAALYADFGDFAFHRLVLEDGHLVAGFGRAMRVKAEDIRLDVSGASALAAAETELIAGFEGESARVAGWAMRLDGAPGDWKVVGLDPEGLDLATTAAEGRAFRRLILPEFASNAAEFQQLSKVLE
jgi:putative heme iron utilization protein